METVVDPGGAEVGTGASAAGAGSEFEQARDTASMIRDIISVACFSIVIIPYDIVAKES